MPHPYQHWLYTWLPLFTGTVWWCTLWAMIITWLCTGRPHYSTMDGTIPYISDIGADFLKPLFVTGCSITGAGFFIGLLVERHLRHTGRLEKEWRKRERIFGWLAVFSSFVGGCGLILLSVFDTKRHTQLHRVFLLVFIVGVGFSAIFTCIEFRWLSKSYEHATLLRSIYIWKAIIASILIILAIAFGITLFQNGDAGGVLEWTISFGYTFYLYTFFFDLRASKGIHKGELSSLSALRGPNREMMEVVV